jgi:hypothetical protein
MVWDGSPTIVGELKTTDAIDFGWGGHTLGGNLFVAREYFSQWGAI